MAALQEDEAAIFLFDFAAAFPSVSQDFLLRALSHIGLPAGALHAVRALYDNNRCRLAFGGQLWGGFLQEAGIRQGCPLSPILFAAIMDPFLRILRRRLPGEFIRAYADDTAAVVRNVREAAPILTHEFRRLAAVANLVLNIPKTVCIPLWPTTMEHLRSMLVSVDATWEQVQAATAGKYLGYYIGPGKGHQSWLGAGAKMVTRVQQWPWNRLGLYYATCAYNLYASSLPTYIAQLEPYPEEFSAIEGSCLAKAAVGPHAWALPPDLFRLKDHYGQVANFRSIKNAALAAKIRVYHYENVAHGGLQVRQRSRALRQAVDQAPYIGRYHTWKDWVDANPLFVLQQAQDDCAARGYTTTVIERAITGPGAARPHSLSTTKAIRRRFQGALAGLLRKAEPYSPEGRMREKLVRWRLTIQPRVAAQRAIRVLEALRSLATPRISNAVLSTQWNRWTTARRFQRTQACCLKCSVDAQDSIEHYACCPVIRTAALTLLRMELRQWPAALGDFLLLTDAPCQDPTVDLPRRRLRMAILVTAAYRTTNSARHSAPAAPAEAADMIRQAMWEAVRNHPGAEAELNRVWSRAPPERQIRRRRLPSAGA